MGKTARLEPDYDILDDDFYAEPEPHLDFDEEDLDNYLDRQDARSERAHRDVLEDAEQHYQLPADWEDFDYSRDDWDNG